MREESYNALLDSVYTISTTIASSTKPTENQMLQLKFYAFKKEREITFSLVAST